jgi:hypothetical protein
MESKKGSKCALRSQEKFTPENSQVSFRDYTAHSFPVIYYNRLHSVVPELYLGAAQEAPPKVCDFLSRD